MDDHPLLGPRIRRYRASISILSVVSWLGLGPLIAIGGGIIAWTRAEDPTATTLWVVAAGCLVLLCMLVHIPWTCSPYLDLHQHGLVVSRRWPGARVHEMWFTEIHPASIRVYSGIDSLRTLPHRRIQGDWHFSGGADLAVTFVGPHPDSGLGVHRPRPPAPGPGLLMFGSHSAPEIADEIRAGLERGGCPPHLSRWSARFGITPVRGSGIYAQTQIAGVTPRWTP